MILGILTLVTALSISAVAIYYSVAGLMAIFAAAALPIMIMGGVLEIGKLVTAVWLHKYWSRATWWLRTYLTTAVLVLMFITSMGIFGFLSSAHIEQTSASTESVARVETLTAEIERQIAILSRAEIRITELESSETNNDASIQSQIDREQARIDSAYERIQPAIQEQNAIIADVTALFQSELDKVDNEINTLQGYIDSGDIERAQAMVGAKVDGDFGPNTARAFTAWQDTKKVERNAWLQQIQDAAQSATVLAAREEIARLRSTAEQQIAQSNALINRLRDQLGTDDNAEQLQKKIDEQQSRIRNATDEIDALTQERIALEAEYRKLEAEVGPIKYIAEFVYGDTADKNLMEEAVRWVIIVIIFVFDPLAVLLLIAAQYTFEFRRKELEDDRGERLRLEQAEYERARAQRIVDNPGVTFDDPVPSGNDNTTNGVVAQQEEKVDDDLVLGETRAGHNGRDTASGMAVARQGDLNDTNTLIKEADIDTDATVRELGATNTVSDDDEAVDRVEQGQVQPHGLTVDQAARAYSKVTPVEKKDIKSSEELKREAEYKAKEQDATFQLSKTAWKEANPDQTLKHYKNLYVKGFIDSLPWESPDNTDNYNTQEGYQQNAEQSENTLFNKLSNK